jgi:hypothetical protein
MQVNYLAKYLKYKQKYLDLKEEMVSVGGGKFSSNDKHNKTATSDCIGKWTGKLFNKALKRVKEDTLDIPTDCTKNIFTKHFAKDPTKISTEVISPTYLNELTNEFNEVKKICLKCSKKDTKFLEKFEPWTKH